MHRSKLVAYAAGIVIAAAGVSAGPLSATSTAEPAKPKPTTTDAVLVSKAKTMDKAYQAVSAFVRG